jgi:hypothetical protein
MAVMTVEFGTRDYDMVIFDIDNYGTAANVGSNIEEKLKAYNLLNETMYDQTFIDDNYRNDDAVNSCIALHVLGFDPVEWFGNFFDDEKIGNRFLSIDINLFMEHVHRICGYGSQWNTNYLLRWGPVGNEGAALGYAID